MKRYITIMILLCSLLPCTLHAESKEQREARKHEVRIGWGDQMFEKFIWHNPQYIVNTMQDTDMLPYKENYRYTQHIFAEYQYRLKSWLGLGLMFDGSAVLWDNTLRNGKGSLVKTEGKQYFANLAIVPTIRFTYFNWKYISMHSGLGIGMNINTGTETDGYGKHTVACPAINLNLFGASFNYEQWFAAVELGGLYALKGAQECYMLNSKLVSVSIGIRF